MAFYLLITLEHNKCCSVVEPVFCIEFNPINHALVATGGQDDIAYIWNSVSGEEVLKCTGMLQKWYFQGFYLEVIYCVSWLSDMLLDIVRTNHYQGSIVLVN